MLTECYYLHCGYAIEVFSRYNYSQVGMELLKKHLNVDRETICAVLDILESCGIIGPQIGQAPRKILIFDKKQAHAVLEAYQLSCARQSKATSKGKVLMKDIDAMSGHEFEHFTAELLKNLAIRMLRLHPLQEIRE